MISFVVGIISCKCEACSSWVAIHPEMGPTCLVPGPNSTKFRKADWMDFIPLANRNMFRGSNLLRKMRWNYPSGAPCLLSNPTIGNYGIGLWIFSMVFLEIYFLERGHSQFIPETEGCQQYSVFAKISWKLIKSVRRCQDSPHEIWCSYKTPFHTYGYKLPIRKNNVTLCTMYTL